MENISNLNFALFLYTASKATCEWLMKSYGGMIVTLNFLEPIEQLQMQAINRWWFDKGVGRVQVRIKLPQTCYFTW